MINVSYSEKTSQRKPPKSTPKSGLLGGYLLKDDKYAEYTVERKIWSGKGGLLEEVGSWRLHTGLGRAHSLRQVWHSLHVSPALCP